MEDLAIIKLLENRDDSGIRALEDKYGSALLHLSSNMLGDEDYAKECVNDTLLRAWNTIPPEHPEYLFAYVAKICRFYSLNRIDWLGAKKRKAEIVELTSELEQCISTDYLEDEENEQEIGEMISDFLRGKKLEQRNIFIRRYYYSDSVQQIAEGFGVSQSKVKTTLFRTRRELKNYLEERGVLL